MLLRLICNSTDKLSYEFGLQQLPALVGRCPESQVQLDDRWVSRRHCELFVRDGTIMVRDLDSRHGIYVNGHLVEQTHLSPGDVLAVGLNKFRVDLAPATCPASAGPMKVARWITAV